jgi:hypothetical protein
VSAEIKEVFEYAREIVDGRWSNDRVSAEIHEVFSNVKDKLLMADGPMVGVNQIQ